MRPLFFILVIGIAGYILSSQMLIDDEAHEPQPAEDSPVESPNVAAPEPTAVSEAPAKAPLLPQWILVEDKKGQPVANVDVWVGRLPTNGPLFLKRKATHALPKKIGSTAWRTNSDGLVLIQAVTGTELYLCAQYADSLAVHRLWPKFFSRGHTKSEDWRRENAIRVHPIPVRRFQFSLRDQDGEPIADSLVAITDGNSLSSSTAFSEDDGLTAYPYGFTDIEGRLTFVTKPSPYSRSLIDTQTLRVIVPRFGGEGFSKNFPVDEKHPKLEIRLQKPAAIVFRLNDGNDEGEQAEVLLKTGSEPVQPVSFIERLLRLDTSHRMSDSALIKVPTSGVKIANFEPNGVVSLSRKLDLQTYMTDRHEISAIAKTETLIVYHAGLAHPGRSARDVAKVEFFIRAPQGRSFVKQQSHQIKVRGLGGRFLSFEILFDKETSRATVLVPSETPCRISVEDPFSIYRGRFRPRPASQSFEVRALRKGEVFDLGAVVFDQPTVILRGRVSDSAGKPLKGVLVVATQERKTTHHRQRWDLKYSDRTDESGRFMLCGRLRNDEPLTLSSRGKWQFSPLEFEPNGAEINIVATQAGKLEGWLKVPSYDLSDEISVTARRSGKSSVTCPISLMGSGRLYASALAEGEYTITVAMSHQVMAQFDGIVIKSGETARPAGLQGPDIPMDDFVQTITVLQPGGAPVRHAEVYCEGLIDGKKVSESAVTNADGIGRFFLPSGGQYRVRIYGPRSDKNGLAFCSHKSSNVSLPTTVELGRKPRIEFELSRPFPSAGGGHWPLRVFYEEKKNVWKQLSWIQIKNGAATFSRNLPIKAKGRFRLFLYEDRTPIRRQSAQPKPDFLFLGEFKIRTVKDQSISIRINRELEARIIDFQRRHGDKNDR